MQHCPRCGIERTTASRYCSNCRFDYWGAAQGDTQPSADAGLAPMPGPRRRGGAGVVAVGGLVLLASGIGFTALTLRSGDGTPVTAAALGGLTGASSPPTADTRGPEIIDAFLAAAMPAEVTFHVDVNGSQVIADDRPDIAPTTTLFTLSADVAGDEYSGAFTNSSTAPRRYPTPASGDLAFVDGKAWERAVGGPWLPAQTVPLFPVNPFIGLQGSADVEYAGSEMAGDVELHHLRVIRWLDGAPTAGIFEEGVETHDVETAFDVYVTSDGIPQYGSMLLNIAVETYLTTGNVDSQADYRFTRWGEPVVITPPFP